jgi:hypothetical protein
MTSPVPSKLIRDFEDLLAWKEARALHRAVCHACQSPTWRHRWGLRDQIKDAAVSVMANLAERRAGKSEVTPLPPSRKASFPVSAQWPSGPNASERKP